MNSYRAAARLLIALLCVGAVAACTGPAPGGPPGTRPPGTRPPVTRPPVTTPVGQPVFKYTATGGLCPWGVCGRELTVDRSGAWSGRDGQKVVEGRLDPAETRDLINRIQTGIPTLADLKPAPELCPSAYDGSDITFTLNVGPKPVTASNCDPADHKLNREVPGDNALLLYLNKLVDRLLASTPAPAKLLVEYHESGGHCRETCPVVTATIGVNGSWTATSGPTTTSGQLSPAATTELTERIRTQVASLPRLPASTGCPSAYDGRDKVFTFHSGGRTVKVSNCDRNFEGSALLDYTGALIETFI